MLSLIDRFMQIIHLDVETTGVEEEDRLCQLAYKFHDGPGFEEMFKPSVPISVEAMSITHITNEDVEDKEIFEKSSMKKELIKIFKDGAIMVAHNANFDLDMISREGIVPLKHICTLKLSHYFDKKAELTRNNLQFLRYYYKLKIDQVISAHDAMGDVIVLEKLFKFYQQHYSIEEMIEISSKPILLKKMIFGKYKGDWFKDIRRKDIDYLMWMRRSMTMDENLKYTVEYYINNSN